MTNFERRRAIARMKRIEEARQERFRRFQMLESRGQKGRYRETNRPYNPDEDILIQKKNERETKKIELLNYQHAKQLEKAIRNILNLYLEFADYIKKYNKLVDKDCRISSLKCAYIKGWDNWDCLDENLLNFKIKDIKVTEIGWECWDENITSEEVKNDFDYYNEEYEDTKLKWRYYFKFSINNKNYIFQEDMNHIEATCAEIINKPVTNEDYDFNIFYTLDLMFYTENRNFRDNVAKYYKHMDYVNIFMAGNIDETGIMTDEGYGEIRSEKEIRDNFYKFMDCIEKCAERW